MEVIHEITQHPFIISCVTGGGISGQLDGVCRRCKITPLGSQQGEFCQLDRALIFEDPDGTRILYDAGRTVAGAEDSRLGRIDAILVSHMHGDHIGDKHIKAVGKGDCSKTEFPVAVLPNTNTVNIALAKNAKIITGSEMPKFLSNKLKALGGDPKNSQLVRFGATRKVGGEPVFRILVSFEVAALAKLSKVVT